MNKVMNGNIKHKNITLESILAVSSFINMIGAGLHMLIRMRNIKKLM